MTVRQKILKLIYPLWMKFNNLAGKKNAALKNTANASPVTPFHNLHATLNNGSTLQFNTLKGKKVLIVNTASNCGYTNQYEDLQKLHEQFGDRLLVIGFPSNDFKEQEKGSDDEIASFCKINYGVSFPLAKKSIVSGTHKNEVFGWLSSRRQNGWNDQEPVWNFSKYLVDENGVLLHYFDPAVSPLSETVINAIQKQ